MTQPFTDSEVNAAVAATVDELKATIEQLRLRYDTMVEDYERIVHNRDEAYNKLQEEIGYHQTLTAANKTIQELTANVQYLETYSRCDADTIEQLQGRVAELETFVSELARYRMPPADDSKEYAWQNRLYAIRTDARKLMGVEDK